MKRAEKFFAELLEESGMSINGDAPQDIRILDGAVYQRVFSSGHLALGESFMDKQWDCDDLAGALSQLLMLDNIWQRFRSPSAIWLIIKSRLFNLQSPRRAFQVGAEHYDYGNDMYQTMLGSSMVYTCADYTGLGPGQLDRAQEQKLESICRQLNLEPGKRLLDIGCGWGGLMKYAAEHYGVECVGISVSMEQTQWARESFGDLPCRIEIVDYRDFYDDQGFDCITSIEMIEAVGTKNFRTYFRKIHSLLRDNGQALIQSIVSRSNKPATDPWIDKYIFPNGVLPNHRQLEQATNHLFDWESIRDIGRYYDLTLMAWWRSLKNGFPKLNQINPDKYNERFLRMMKYYLHNCAALFRTRHVYDWQIVMTKSNLNV